MTITLTTEPLTYLHLTILVDVFYICSFVLNQLLSILVHTRVNLDRMDQNHPEEKI